MWTNLVPVLIYYGPAAVCLAQCTAPCTIARYRQRWREDKHIFHQQLLPAPLQSFPPVIPIFPPEANPAFHNSGANEAFLFRRFPSEGWRGPSQVPQLTTQEGRGTWLTRTVISEVWISEVRGSGGQTGVDSLARRGQSGGPFMLPCFLLWWKYLHLI